MRNGYLDLHRLLYHFVSCVKENAQSAELANHCAHCLNKMLISQSEYSVLRGVRKNWNIGRIRQLRILVLWPALLCRY